MPHACEHVKGWSVLVFPSRSFVTASGLASAQPPDLDPDTKATSDKYRHPHAEMPPHQEITPQGSVQEVNTTLASIKLLAFLSREPLITTSNYNVAGGGPGTCIVAMLERLLGEMSTRGPAKSVWQVTIVCTTQLSTSSASGPGLLAQVRCNSTLTRPRMTP